MRTASFVICHRSSLRRRGFSFTEVMFAVIILGIGFIMVAAIFPVAIQQTRLTVDESAAASVARQATSVLEQVMAGSEKAAGGNPLFPATAVGAGAPPSVFPIRPNGVMPGNAPPPELWAQVRGSLISASDPRFAWTMLYRRAPGSQFVQVYIFVLQQRNRTVFDARDLEGTPANLQPRRVTVRTIPAASGSPEPDTIAVTVPNQRFDVEGAFVVTADATAADPSGAGRIYRLGTYRGPASGGGELYEVDPGYDVPDSALVPVFNGNAWLVGRGFEAGAPPNGPAMDVAFYTTFLTVN
jgi:prepilin-type N-terminal cleavage/methylation domain-containing protein